MSHQQWHMDIPVDSESTTAESTTTVVNADSNVSDLIYRVQFDMLGTRTLWFRLVIICDIIWCVN